MDFRVLFRGISGYFVFVFFALFLFFLSTEKAFLLPGVEIFADGRLNNLFVIFVGFLVWLISPAGFLYILIDGWKIKKRSVLSNKISVLIEVFSMIIWLSIMLVLLLVYIDGVYFHILDLRSEVLNLAIASGFIFGFVIVLKSAWRKIGMKGENNRDDLQEDEIEGEFVEVVGGEENSSEKKNVFCGFKEKVKRRLKQDLKDIVNEEIDKRF